MVTYNIYIYLRSCSETDISCFAITGIHIFSGMFSNSKVTSVKIKGGKC